MNKKETDLKFVFGNSSYWTINKKLAKDLGLEAALIIQHFYDLQTKVFNGEFYQTYEQISEHLHLKRRRIENAIELLKKVGFLTVTKKGLPQKNHYKVECANLSTYFLYNDEFSKFAINSELATIKSTV